MEGERVEKVTKGVTKSYLEPNNALKGPATERAYFLSVSAQMGLRRRGGRIRRRLACECQPPGVMLPPTPSSMAEKVLNSSLCRNLTASRITPPWLESRGRSKFPGAHTANEVFVALSSRLAELMRLPAPSNFTHHLVSFTSNLLLTCLSAISFCVTCLQVLQH